MNYKRYNSTERIGVNSVERIFITEFDWIFREQETVDVGIDALVEQSENRDPKGKFLALQIKTGSSHFHVTKESLIYYMSNVHYNYWMNFDIPVILVAHIPGENLTYWQEIDKGKILKTKNKWKLPIPKSNVLNKKAKPELTKLLTSLSREYTSLKIFSGDKIEDDTIFHLAEKSSCISDANDAIERMSNILGELDIKTNESNEEFVHFNNIGQSFKSPEVVAVVWRFSKNLILFSKRIENEIQIFSEMFAEGIFGYQLIIKSYSFLKDLSDYSDPTIKRLEALPSIIDNTNLNITSMKKSIKSFPDEYSSLNEAKIVFENMVDLMLEENETAKKMILSLLRSFRK
jgi:Domain of unknown function (DUF4365)